MHEGFLRIAQNAETAVLFIHGIAGSPAHFTRFVQLVPPEMTVQNLLLAGHGKGVRDFSKASMNMWEEQVEDAVDALLESHREVYIAAHSMGTLFAIDQALRHASVTKLFLLAPPLKLHLRAKMVTNAWKVYTNKIAEDDAAAIAARACSGIAHDAGLLHYLGWIPRYLELFSKIRKTRPLAARLRIPCRVFQSAGDEMVSRMAAKYFAACPYAAVAVLPHSGHYYYEAQDRDFLERQFMEWLS